MYLFQHDKTFYYAWELLSKVILFSLSRSESSSNLSSMYLWTLNFDIFLLFCGSKYRWLSGVKVYFCRQFQRFCVSTFWEIPMYCEYGWRPQKMNVSQGNVFILSKYWISRLCPNLFFSRMLRKTGLPKRARIFLSARRMWRIWTMLWWKWRTGLHFQRQTTIPKRTGIDIVLTKYKALQSICNCRQIQIVPANVMMDNVWTTEINSAMEFQIVVMEVMNFDAWIVDMEFLSTWDAMANQIVLMSRMNFSVLL